MNFVKSNSFDLYLLGHSCGEADKIILSHLFIHNQCSKIYLYLYQYETNGIIEDDSHNKRISINGYFNDKNSYSEKMSAKDNAFIIPQIKNKELSI